MRHGVTLLQLVELVFFAPANVQRFGRLGKASLRSKDFRYLRLAFWVDWLRHLGSSFWVSFT
jgi:hypothetical protein